MQIVSPAVARRKREDQAYGYALFMAYQDIKFCTNDDQRDGYNSARKGALACATVDVTFAIGGNASDADYALGAWQ